MVPRHGFGIMFIFLLALFSYASVMASSDAPSLYPLER